MGWLFALSLGLQQRRERAIWLALLPIAAGHATSVALVAGIVFAGLRFASATTLQWLTAVILLAFGIYKLFNYSRHPRWVGMKVGLGGLFLWSFLMATAHGAGLMVVPAVVGMARLSSAYCGSLAQPLSQGLGVVMAIGAHTLAMLMVMGAIAWLVYKKLGLAVLCQQWVNFDLMWAVALLLVGGMALFMAIPSGS